MKRIRRIILIFVPLVLLGTIFLFQGSLWKRPLVSALNQNILNPSGWHLQLRSLTGHVLTTLNVEQLVLENENGIRLYVEAGRIRINLPALFQRKYQFRLVDLQGIDATFQKMSGDIVTNGGPDELRFFPLFIQDLRLGGQLHVPTDTAMTTLPFALLGQFQASDQRGKLQIETLDILPPKINDTLNIYNSIVIANPTEISCFPLNGTVGSFDISGEVSASVFDGVMQGSLAFNPVNIHEFIPDIPFFDTTLTQVDGRITFQSKGDLITGQFQLNPLDRQPIQGRLVLEERENGWVLDSLFVERKSSTIMISGASDSLKQFNAIVELKPFHLDDWAQVPFENSVNGSIILFGQVQFDTSVSLTASFNINETKALVTPTLISGTADYRNHQIRLLEPLLINQAGGQIQIIGSYDFSQKLILGDFKASNLDLKPFRNLTGGALGIVSGMGHVEGSINQPQIKAEISLKHGQYKDLSLDAMEVVGQLKVDSTGSEGSFHLTSDKLQWQNQLADNFTGDFHLGDSVLIFDNIHVSRDQDYIQLSGDVTWDGSVTLDRFQAAYAGHLMVNPKPIRFTLSSEGVRTRPFEIHVDDGIISGVVRKEKNWDLRLKITNISSELVSSFIPDDRLRFTGNLFGELGINTAPEDRKISIDMSLKNGKIAGESFDDMIVAGLFEQGILHIDEIALTHNGRTGLQVSGIIPVKSDTSHPVMIDLSTHFNQFHLETLTQFIPNFFTIGGLVSGTFDLGGSSRNTTFRYDLVIEDGTFDRLKLGQVSGTGNYQNHRWTMNDYASVKGTESLQGSGFLPVDFDLGSPTFGRLIKGDSLYIFVQGKKHDLDFLSAYLTDLDSARGDFDLKLTLSGKPEKIIRDGSMKIVDGRLYTPLLDNPIRHINGHLTIADNLLYIQDFSGVMRQKSSSMTPNLTLSGEMDLSRFFHPRFNVKVDGKDIYFSSIAEDMKGNVDVDLTITGRDTITIAGTIPVNQVELTMEFVSETPGAVVAEPGATIPYYKITFPIVGELNLVNQQVDANLGGEVSLSQLGNEATNYSGELFVKDGRFYYSGGIFKDLNGYMSFDGKGFNPYLDFSAQTNIDGEIIRISLTGPLDNPVMNLTSASNFSQSDILQLLTWRKRFSDQDLTSTGLGTQAQAIFTAWFESQLEKNLMEFSGLDRLGIVEDVSISGLSPSGKEDLTIKADLSQKVSLNYAYRRSFSLTNPTHMLGVEYKFNRYLSVVGNIDQAGNFQAKYRLRYSY